ncbi:MAG TPA: MiaB/RimO family radical SAM methylthiotransferase [Acidobacteriaceae bacterium]|nr:MiaB/RimO family radical SAM methylthiotransferase [Acidobacteriaceae bacterium]
MEEYHVENFGCRASQADGEAIGLELGSRGLAQAASAETADVVVVNTCSVTAQADRTARAFLRRLQRRNPRARVLVTGCYAQRAPEEVAALPGVQAVVGNSHKGMVAQLAAGGAFVPLRSLQGGERPWAGPVVYVDEVFAHSALAAACWTGTRGHTRPNLKVQDGCGNRCSFCVIPVTRGHSRSMPMEDCLRSVESFASSGGVELVLSGINLGRWGRDLSPARTLEQLVAAILRQTSLPRLRLSSVEPMDWTAELLSLFSNEAGEAGGRLARHAHLPLQSGADATLRAMHRRYRPWHYAEKLAAIRKCMPDAAIGADVMVGFPGESDALFEESYAFIAEQPFTYLHLFPFSPRPGTPAGELHRRDAPPPGAVAERMARLRGLIAAKNLAFRERFVGGRLPAVTLETAEEMRGQGRTRALTDNFIEVDLEATIPANRNIQAGITEVRSEGLAGRVAA